MRQKTWSVSIFHHASIKGKLLVMLTRIDLRSLEPQGLTKTSLQPVIKAKKFGHQALYIEDNPFRPNTTGTKMEANPGVTNIKQLECPSTKERYPNKSPGLTSDVQPCSHTESILEELWEDVEIAEVFETPVVD